MPKNLFEEVALAQQQEELARLKIIAKIKANDLRGAHKLARPYLKKLSDGYSNGETIPTGWTRIAQILCAKDIELHGIDSQSSKEEIPNEGSWVEMALDIVSTRIKGVLKALVPASMAIALIAQVLQPTTSQAGNPSALGITPDEIAIRVSDVNKNGKLEVEAKSQLTKKGELTKPELVWSLESKGEGSKIPKDEIKLIGSTLIRGGEESGNIRWELKDVSFNSKTNLIEAKLTATNTSKSDIKVAHFSVSDTHYEGCSIKLSDQISQDYNQYRSPSALPAQKTAVYHLSIPKDALPIIMFRTAEGETHSMILRLPSFERLKEASEKKLWASYSAKNQGYSDLDLEIETPDGAKVESILVEDSRGQRSLMATQEPLKIKPSQTMTFSVTSTKSSSPDLKISTKSKNQTREYFVTSSNCSTFKERLERGYERLVNIIIGSSPSPLTWDDIKTSYDKKISPLIEDEGLAIQGSKLMSVLVKQNMDDEGNIETLYKMMGEDIPAQKKAAKNVEEDGIVR